MSRVWYMEKVVGRVNGKWKLLKVLCKWEYKTVRMIIWFWIKIKKLKFKFFDLMAFLEDKFMIYCVYGNGWFNRECNLSICVCMGG